MTDIDAIHKELLILLEKFHEICTQNGISYSIHGGTMLGAVRERGFIPWDDDADITLFRPEYDKFCALMKRSPPEPGFAFVELERYPQFVMRREGKPAVWLDLFVYDFISEKPLEQKFKLLGTDFFIFLTRTAERQRLSNLYFRKGWRKTALNLLFLICQIIPYSSRLALARWFMPKFPGNGTRVHRSNDTRVGMRLILPVSVVNSGYQLIPFENTELMILRDYHTVLLSSYGDDYMTPIQNKSEGIQAAVHAEDQEILGKFVTNGKNAL